MRAATALPEIVDRYGYERVLIYASRTLNRETPVVKTIADALGSRLVGVSDEVGEHAPVNNIIKAIHRVYETNADVMIGVGGGSVFDFGKFVQMGVWAGVKTREELLSYQSERGVRPLDAVYQPPESMGTHRFRQIAVPTTFSTAEATSGGTPVDDETGAKVRFTVRQGAPRAVVYDPEVVTYTPTHLLMATGIRGLDHAMNTVMSTEPNVVAETMALNAIPRFFEYLPKIREDRSDLRANAQCQLATWFAIMGQSVGHGFSYASVHVLGPWALVGHGEAACVMMLAQARWFSEVSSPAMDAIAEAVGRPGVRFDQLVLELLQRLQLPTSLAELGVTRDKLPALAEAVHAHPIVHRYNLRPIDTLEDVTAVLQGVAD
ncbi:MAG: iron-containing alcohol dehydrogenase [Actinobacteria bacterium]|nr:iron-containing alcohol dehydrogenase [Actinomycetota bacterium]